MIGNRTVEGSQPGTPLPKLGRGAGVRGLSIKGAHFEITNEH